MTTMTTLQIPVNDELLQLWQKLQQKYQNLSATEVLKLVFSQALDEADEWDKEIELDLQNPQSGLNNLLKKAKTDYSEFQHRVQQWQNKYLCDYDLFTYKTSTDEIYVKELNQQFATADWEGDLFEWEVDQTELKRWQQQLQNLLTLL